MERGVDDKTRKTKRREIHRTKIVRCKTVPHFADSVRNDGGKKSRRARRLSLRYNFIRNDAIVVTVPGWGGVVLRLYKEGKRADREIGVPG